MRRDSCKVSSCKSQMYHKISEDGDQLKRVMKRFSRDFQFTSFLWQNQRPLGDHYLEFSAASFKSCSSLGIEEKDIKKKSFKIAVLGRRSRSFKIAVLGRRSRSLCLKDFFSKLKNDNYSTVVSFYLSIQVEFYSTDLVWNNPLTN